MNEIYYSLMYSSLLSASVLMLYRSEETEVTKIEVSREQSSVVENKSRATYVLITPTTAVCGLACPSPQSLPPKDMHI